MQIEFSVLSVYKFLFLALILFLVLRVLFFIIPLFIKRNEKLKKLKKVLPIVEFFSWGFFFVWAFNFFLTKNSVLAAILFFLTLIIGVWATWYFMKEYLIGLVIRTGGRINEGETVTIGEYTGVVSKFERQVLCLDRKAGDSVQVPYSSVFKSELIKGSTTQKGKVGNVTGNMIRLTVTKNNTITETVDQLRIKILNLPWVTGSAEPVIKLESETENSYIFDIMLYTYDNKYLYKIEDNLKNLNF
ncbi:MAG: hypothetical protein U9N85_14375 [Bacteroidota bacterium]|nr:hypothetical protein [Bacteroidota bacterium]